MGQNRNERECSVEKRDVEETTAREEISAGFVGAESGGMVVFGEKMRRKERPD